MSDRTSIKSRTTRDEIVRWECHCQMPPVLLGTYDGTGTVHIKVRDRYWHIIGIVKTTCPRCGSEHVLSLDRGQGGKSSLTTAVETSLS
jgi:hypothetical protein